MNGRLFTQCPTISDKLDEIGYEIHVMLGSKLNREGYKRARVFCPETIYHTFGNISQKIVSHYKNGTRVKPEKDVNPLKIVYNEMYFYFVDLKYILILLHKL